VIERLAHAALALAACLVACQRVDDSRSPVDVLYAGSLTAIMERSLGPDFEEWSGRPFRGEGRGSTSGARLVADGVREPDVYVTADEATLSLLERHWDGWAVRFARGELTVAYSADSRFRAALDSAARGQVAWYDVLLRTGFRFGRTDPELDPKGYRTLWMFELAGRHYADRSLPGRLVQASPDRRAVFPEAHLAARLEGGQLDAGAFYVAEARSHGLRFIPLPPQINLGSGTEAELYGNLAYRTRSGETVRGGPITYSATVPRNAGDRAAAIEFIRFLIGPHGAQTLAAAGFPPVRTAVGDPRRIPDRLLKALDTDAGP
jgi:molybdate/tungstate transport system substrate-binding protein